MPSQPKIAVVYPASIPWMAHFLDGVRRYSNQIGGWRIYTSPPTFAATGEPAHSLASLIGWKGDAAIATIRSKEETELAKSLGFPVVNISTWESNTHGLPRVGVDNRLAGRLAAEHLLGRGLRSLGFVGWKNVHYSDERLAGFSGRAAEENVGCHVHLNSAENDGATTWGEHLQQLAAWASSLPHPCGIFAVHDYRAQLLMEACESAGLRVPQDVAVIGMDDDVIICEHSVPTLTSVSRNSGMIGWETASLIHRILEGSAGPPGEIFVPPDGVRARQSTDMFHHSDQVVQVAVGFMLTHLREGFNIQAVAEYAGVSKRTLETRFRASTGKSPHRYLTEARIAHAKQLIGQPNKITLRAIAEECGFGSYPSFFTAFTAIEGRSPQEHVRETGKIQPEDFGTGFVGTGSNVG